VEFFAAPQKKVTFARLTRKSGRYRMHFFTGSFVRFGEEKDRELASQTSPEWPHAFARFDCSREALASEYSSNHIHAILGDWMGELQAVCEATGIEAYPMS
jgi:L-fucose/D-arabinose isomerase